MRIQIKQNYLQKISTLFAFYLAVSSIFPPLRALPGYNQTSLIAMIAWVIFASISKPAFLNVFSKNGIHKQVILFFVMYTFLFPYLFGNNIISHRYLSYAQVLIFYLIYQYNRAYGYDKSSMMIIKWSFPFILYTSVQTLYGLIKNPYLSRSIKSKGDDSVELLSQGIGGYDFIYFLVFICIMLMFLILNKKSLGIRLRKQVIIYLLFTLFVITVVYSNYFTALIIITVSLVILVATRKSSLITKLFSTVVGILLLIQGKEIFLIVTNWLIYHLNSGRTVERILSLQADILGYGSASLMADRSSTLATSWNAFLENPFLGITSKTIESSGGFLIGFGQHSQFLDTFALYGIFIGLLNIYIIVQPFLNRFNGYRVFISINFAMLVSVLMLFAMNTVSPSIGYAIFFIYPVIYDTLSDRLNKKIRDKE